MLSQRYSSEDVEAALIPRTDWRPFPPAAERTAWDTLPDAARQSAIAAGEELLGYEWPSLPATRFLEFARNGNRSRYEDLSFSRRGALADLVMAECFEHRGRFMDDILNGIWCICEESYWGIPAHVGMQRAGSGLPDTSEPTVDLFAAETSALMAWVSYLLAAELDELSPLIRARIQREMDTRILTPLMERDDFWWMGLRGQYVNNWNPWINSNWLASVLLLEDDPARRSAAVVKSMRSIDRFVDPYPKDGGCDEGPSYWCRAGASLFDCLELLLSATDGAVDIYSEPLVRNIAAFIYRVHISERYFVNFADAPALVDPPAAQVLGFGHRVGDSAMQALGAWLASSANAGIRKRGQSIGRRLHGLFTVQGGDACAAAPPLPRDVWLDEIQVMTARDRVGSSDGFFVAAKGGHNAESHNHNDVGTFIVYRDGKPLLVDAGVEQYTAKTFSNRRYELWTMQSGSHSFLPTVDGVMQQQGATFAARDAVHHAGDDAATLSLDIAGAYPADAGLNRWVRTIALKRGSHVGVTDEYELAGEAKEITFCLMTPCRVELGSCGELLLSEAQLPGGRVSAQGAVAFDAGALSVELIEQPLTDARLTATWGERLTRILFHAVAPPRTGRFSLRVT